nr:ABC transporter permease [Pseudoflavonifractor sp. 524-17]
MPKKQEMSQKDGFIHNFSKHKLAVIAFFILVLEVAAVLLVPALLGLDPITTNKTAFSSPATAAYLLGTDDVGRDLLARLLTGGRVSMTIGLGATIVSVLVGLPLGLVAGYYRGKVETLIMRSADIFLSFPAIVLNLVIVAVLGTKVPLVPLLITTIGVLRWPAVAKLIYGNVLSVRGREFVEAERAIGSSDFKIIFKIVLPNSIAPLWVSLAFRISDAMLTESALSFLGQHYPGGQKPERTDQPLVAVGAGGCVPDGDHCVPELCGRRGARRTGSHGGCGRLDCGGSRVYGQSSQSKSALCLLLLQRDERRCAGADPRAGPCLCQLSDYAQPANQRLFRQVD